MKLQGFLGEQLVCEDEILLSTEIKEPNIKLKGPANVDNSEELTVKASIRQRPILDFSLEHEKLGK
jgi:hypothetical protein